MKGQRRWGYDPNTRRLKPSHASIGEREFPKASNESGGIRRCRPFANTLSDEVRQGLAYSGHLAVSRHCTPGGETGTKVSHTAIGTSKSAAIRLVEARPFGSGFSNESRSDPMLLEQYRLRSP